MQPRWPPVPWSACAKLSRVYMETPFSHFHDFTSELCDDLPGTWYIHTAIIPGPSMCRTEEENVSGVDSAHVTAAPSVLSKEDACRPLPLGPLTRRQRPHRPLTGARRAALVTLLCAVAAAIGTSRGWHGASWWTNSGRGKDESAADLFNERLNISTSGVSVLRFGCSYYFCLVRTYVQPTMVNPILFWSVGAMRFWCSFRSQVGGRITFQPVLSGDPL